MKRIDSNWLEVDASQLVDDQFEEKNGVEIHIGLSPFDVPSAVRGYYDESIQKFVVAFQYLETGSNEETEETQHDANVSLDIGIFSGRIYRIIINVVELGLPNVRLRLSMDELDTAIHNSGKNKRRRRSRIRNTGPLRAAVKQNREKIIPDSVIAE